MKSDIFKKVFRQTAVSCKAGHLAAEKKLLFTAYFAEFIFNCGD